MFLSLWFVFLGKHRAVHKRNCLCLFESNRVASYTMISKNSSKTGLGLVTDFGSDKDERCPSFLAIRTDEKTNLALFPSTD